MNIKTDTVKVNKETFSGMTEDERIEVLTNELIDMLITDAEEINKTQMLSCDQACNLFMANVMILRNVQEVNKKLGKRKRSEAKKESEA